MYLMFLGAFQEGGDFRETGIVGIRRFLDKVWMLAHEASLTPGASPGLSKEVERKLHQTIKKVGADTESLNYNTAIAAMMEYVNELREQGARSREHLEPLVIMLAPYAPHFAEELWELLGHDTSVFAARWPAHDEGLATSGDVEIAVQVNGRLRSRLTVARGMAEDQVVALALADEAVKKFVDGQKVKKVIYVQDRLVNLVV
jgi:leucyl-tRNA synthetase